MVFQVYKIESFDARGNSHNIGIREENWFVRPDKTFDDEETAREYVRNQNRMHSILSTYLISMKTEKDKREFIDHFCFARDSPYIHERKYFLEYSKDIQKNILKNLKQNGIRIAV